MSCKFSQYDGSYVLGSLSPAERQQFERHLADCGTCARAVRELAGLPGLLSRVDVAAVENPAPVEPVPATLLPALVAEVRRTRRRRTSLVAGAVVAAAVAAIASLVVGGVLGGQPDVTAGQSPAATASATPGTAMTQVGQHRLSAQLGLEQVAWGTRLSVVCTYKEENHYPHGRTPAYSLVVRTRDGDTEQVATWRAVPGRTTTVTAATASSRRDIASVEVRTLSGGAVVLKTT